MKLRRPSASMVVALIALVMAMGGSAVAASTLITSKQIKNGTIQTADISKKAKKALKGNRGATGATGATGSTGAQGPKGDKGDPGTPGTNGTNGTNGATNVVVRTASGSSDASASFATADCNAGERATGGGVSYARTGASVPRVRYSFPVPASAGQQPTGWSADIDNDGTGTVQAFVYVVCAQP